MEIIKKIIQMDKAAAARVAETVEREKNLLNSSSEQEMLETRAALEEERNEAKKHLHDAEKSLAEKLSVSEKECEERCKQLDDIFAQHKSEWKNEILDRITGG